jgi:hypothetical protein
MMTVLDQQRKRHRHQEFIRFLNAIEAELPKAKAVHVILDNYKQPKVRAWLARHPGRTFHIVPSLAHRSMLSRASLRN